jgi:ubiquinol-cytochrome c reductase iron-sulfur subunit
MTTAPRDRRGVAVGVVFFASVLASVGLAIVYIAGGSPQVEGALLLVALGGIGVGLILWAKRFMPVGVDVEEREPLPSTTAERAVAGEAFTSGAELVARRRVLVRMLAAALGALGVAALFPIRSLGRAPGGALFHTRWRAGVRAVDGGGTPVQAAQVTPGTVITVFPEGYIGTADSQTLLIGLGPGLYRPASGREDWAPEGVIGYSKICTHVGCPVGLYQPSEHLLFCPCHQSAFDVLDGARPVAGPAARPLPQLPLAIDDQGYVVAQADFPEPVGPGFWERGRD